MFCAAYLSIFFLSIMSNAYYILNYFPVDALPCFVTMYSQCLACNASTHGLGTVKSTAPAKTKPAVTRPGARAPASKAAPAANKNTGRIYI